MTMHPAATETTLVGVTVTSPRRLTTAALNALLVVLLAFGAWLAYTGLTERELVPTYNHEPGVVVPVQPQPQPVTPTKETPHYV